MSTSDFELTAPPAEARARELWLQHAAGFILFEDVRRYAMEELGARVSLEAKRLAERAVDRALYGLMMVIDGVGGTLRNAQNSVNLQVNVRLAGADGETVEELDLARGDGMCMGYHGWLEGDFGKNAPATPDARAKTGDTPKPSKKTGAKARSKASTRRKR